MYALSGILISSASAMSLNNSFYHVETASGVGWPARSFTPEWNYATLRPMKQCVLNSYPDDHPILDILIRSHVVIVFADDVAAIPSFVAARALLDSGIHRVSGPCGREERLSIPRTSYRTGIPPAGDGLSRFSKGTAICYLIMEQKLTKYFTVPYPLQSCLAITSIV